MGKLIALSLVFFSAGAKAYPCPRSITDDLKEKRLQEWVVARQGRATVGDCEVEITACDPGQAAGASGPIGEIYLRDKNGREAYLPLVIIEGGRPYAKTRTKIYANRLSYLKYDYLFENEDGRTEAYRLDIRLNKKADAIQSIDLAAYSTHKKLRRPGGSASRWYNCGENAGPKD